MTQSEWAFDFGGAKPENLAARHEFKQLPFYCCSLSLQPVEVPVCTREGEVFDFMQIVPYLRKNGNKHPHTGAELKPSDLIKLNLRKNEAGEYFCPVLLKGFGPHSKIVANAKTGNVYSWEAVQEMNISKAYWKDLITEEPFTKEDLIILQDPVAPKNKASVIKESLKISAQAANGVEERVNLSGGVGRVLKELKLTAIPELSQAPETASPEADELHGFATHTSGKLAASLTSTAMSLQTSSERAILDEAETLARHFLPGKEVTGSVCLRTNFGDMFFTLFASKSPRCTYNFLELAKKGYFDNTQFHRLVKGFCLQGGDPTGMGSGGESCWGRPFGESSLHPSLKHSERGILSMANSGNVNANSSQFFITLRETPHLDGKHPIFGKILAGSEVLDAIESEVEVDTANGHVPLEPIKLLDVIVLENPFEDVKKQIQQRKQVTAEKQTTTNSNAPQIGKYLVTKRKK